MMINRLNRGKGAAARNRERGDVPGWVLITLMTAMLVTALFSLARDRLLALFTQALTGITGP